MPSPRLDRRAGAIIGGAWSTRAANALAAALDAGQGDRIPAFYALLQENQTTADGTTHPSDADILAFAQQAGITADLSDAVASQRFGAWVQASNDHWLGSTIAGTGKVVSGVPVLVIGNEVPQLPSVVRWNGAAARVRLVTCSDPTPVFDNVTLMNSVTVKTSGLPKSTVVGEITRLPSTPVPDNAIVPLPGASDVTVNT